MARPIRTGLLRRRITIEQNTPVKDAAGGLTDNWTAFATIWASKADLRGREFQAAQQVNAEITTEWIIRWLDGLKRDMRISYRGEVFNIRHIGEFGNEREGMRLWTTGKVE